ncbi:venom acid phosphatase Acph-1 [Xylocopa sonorina]|uniref:venom acid phosphatase Acph-1 n=1 Tax=Xylocopa sonorina TaxID=1818115 RepID=UPI00403AB672
MLFNRLVTFNIFLLSAVVTVNCDLDVQLLHVVFRHGEKVPQREFQNYPNDPYRDYSYGPLGDGDLTNQGKLREYKIGTMLRGRYKEYFGPDYWPEKIYARSTSVARTQLSLQLVMAGLFPPSERQTWNPQLPWIPTFTFFEPYAIDNLLFPDHCPRYQSEYSKFLSQNKARDLISKYKSDMVYLTERTGKPINTTSAVTHLYNLLKEQAAHNLTLPQWTKTVFPTTMKEIVALDFKLRSYTRTLKRLNGGLMIRKIVDDIKMYKAGKLEPYDRKAFLFAAHEMNVAAVARALELDEPIIPAYGSTLIFETLRDKKKNYYVRVLLWTGVSEQLTIQTIRNCVELCPLEDFFAIVKDILPSDEEYYCRPIRNLEKVTNIEQEYSSVSSSTVANIWDWFLTLLFIKLSFICIDILGICC